MNDNISNQNTPLQPGTPIAGNPLNNQIEADISTTLDQVKSGRVKAIADLLDSISEFQSKLKHLKKDFDKYYPEAPIDKWNNDLDKYYIELEKELRERIIKTGNPSSVIFQEIKNEIIKGIVAHVPTEHRNDSEYIQSLILNFPFLQEINKIQNELNQKVNKTSQQLLEQKVETVIRDLIVQSRSEESNNRSSNNASDPDIENLGEFIDDPSLPVTRDEWLRNTDTKKMNELIDTLSGEKYKTFGIVNDLKKTKEYANHVISGETQQKLKTKDVLKNIKKESENFFSAESNQGGYDKLVKSLKRDGEKIQDKLDELNNQLNTARIHNSTAEVTKINQEIEKLRLERTELDNQLLLAKSSLPNIEERLNAILKQKEKIWKSNLSSEDKTRLVEEIENNARPMVDEFCEDLSKVIQDNAAYLPSIIRNLKLANLSDGQLRIIISESIKPELLKVKELISEKAANPYKTLDTYDIKTAVDQLLANRDSVQFEINATEEARRKLASELQSLVKDLTKSSKLDQILKREPSAFLASIKDTNFDLSKLSPKELLAVTQEIEREVETGQLDKLFSTVRLQNLAKDLAYRYADSLQNYEKNEEQRLALKLARSELPKINIPWEGLTSRYQLSDGTTYEFVDYDFDQSPLANKVSQLVSASDLDKPVATVLPIRDETIEMMSKLGIIDDDGYYNIGLINAIKQIAEKSSNSISPNETEIVEKFKAIETSLTARAYAQEIRANNLDKFTQQFLNQLAPGDRIVLDDERNIVNSNGIRRKLSEQIASQVFDEISWKIGFIQANASKQIPKSTDNKDIEDIVKLTSENSDKFLLKNDEAIRELVNNAIDTAFKENLVNFTGNYSRRDLSKIREELKAQLHSSVKAFNGSDLATKSRFDASFVGSQDSATKASAAGVLRITEDILVEGESQWGKNINNLAKANQADVTLDQTTPASETAEKSSKAKKADSQTIRREQKVSYFAPTPSHYQYLQTRDDLRKFVSIGGRDFDRNEALRNYFRQEEMSKAIVSKNTEEAALTQQSEFGDYLLATLRGGDEWLKFKQNREVQKKHVQELKFWNAISKIPLIGQVAEAREYIDEITSQLPQTWQGDLKKTGNDIFGNGKINPILPSLLSAQDAQKRAILTKLALSAGIIAEDASAKDPFSNVLKFFLGGKSGIQQEVDLGNGKTKKVLISNGTKLDEAGIAQIPFLTKGVVLFKPRIYQTDKHFRDENGKVISRGLAPSVNLFQRKRLQTVDQYKISSIAKPVKAWGINQVLTDPLLQMTGLVKYEWRKIGNDWILTRVNRPLSFVDNIGNKLVDKSLDTFTNTKVGKKIGLANISEESRLRFVDTLKFDEYTKKRRSIFEITLRIIGKTIEEGVKGIVKTVDRAASGIKQYDDFKASMGFGQNANALNMTKFAFTQASAALNVFKTVGAGVAKSIPSAAVSGIAGSYLGGKILGQTGAVMGAFAGAALGGTTRFVDYMTTPLAELNGKGRFRNVVDRFWSPDTRTVKGKNMADYLGNEYNKALYSGYRNVTLLNLPVSSISTNYYNFLNADGTLLHDTNLIADLKNKLQLDVNSKVLGNSIDPIEGRLKWGSDNALQIYKNGQWSNYLDINNNQVLREMRIGPEGYIQEFQNGVWKDYGLVTRDVEFIKNGKTFTRPEVIQDNRIQALHAKADSFSGVRLDNGSGFKTYELLYSDGSRVVDQRILKKVEDLAKNGKLRLLEDGSFEMRAGANWVPYATSGLHAELHNFNFESSNEFKELLRRRGLEIRQLSTTERAALEAKEKLGTLTRIERNLLSGKPVPMLRENFFKFAGGNWKAILFSAGIGFAAGGLLGLAINGIKDLLGIKVDLTSITLPAAIGGAIIGAATPVITRWLSPTIASALSPESSFGNFMRVLDSTKDPQLFAKLAPESKWATKIVQKFGGSSESFRANLISARSGLNMFAATTFLADLLGAGDKALLYGAIAGAATLGTELIFRKAIIPAFQTAIDLAKATKLGQFITRINPLFHLPVLDALGVGISVAMFNETFVTPFRSLQMWKHLDVYFKGGEYTITTQIPSMNFDGTYTINHKVKFEGILNNPYYLNAFLNTVPLGIVLPGLGLIGATRSTLFDLAKNFGPNSIWDKVARGLQGSDTIWTRIVNANAGRSGFVNWVSNSTKAVTSFFEREITGNILKKGLFNLGKNAWNFLKNANPFNWKIGALTGGGLAGGLIGGIIGGLITTALFGASPFVAVGAFVGGWIGMGIGTTIAGGLGFTTGGLGFLASTGIISVFTALGNIVGGGIGKLVEGAWSATFGAAEKALQLAQEAFSRLMGVFSLVKAYLDGDLAKMIMTVFQMSMAGMVAGPILIGLPLTASLFTPTDIPPNQIALLPISTYVTKSFNTGSYDPKVPSVKYAINVDPSSLTNGSVLYVSLADKVKNVSEIKPAGGDGWKYASIDPTTRVITITGNIDKPVTLIYEMVLADTLDKLNGFCNNLEGSVQVIDANGASTNQSQVNSSVCLDKNGSLINNTDIYTPVKIGRTPVNPGSVSQCFGENLTQYGKHQGMDIAVPSGTAVYAVDDAIVVRTGWDTSGGYFIQYKLLNESIYIIYYHLQTIAVSVGQEVKSGDAIGLADSTGAHTTGPHLHIEVRTTDAFNGTSTLVNPCYLQDATGKSICTNYPGGERCIPNLY